MNNIAANIKSILYNQNNKVLDTKIFSNDSNYAAFKALERVDSTIYIKNTIFFSIFYKRNNNF